MRNLLLASIIIVALGLGIATFLKLDSIGFFAVVPVNELYGKWTEQGVAYYSADKFEFRKDGIYMEGSRKTSKYKFNGSRLKFVIGGKEHVFLVKSAELMEREKPLHYTSYFEKVYE